MDTHRLICFRSSQRAATVRAQAVCERGIPSRRDQHLEDALDDAWRRVEQSKAPWASEDYSTAGRTILAQHIIKMTRDGERDPRWLADSALLYLSQQKLTGTPAEDL